MPKAATGALHGCLAVGRVAQSAFWETAAWRTSAGKRARCSASMSASTTRLLVLHEAARHALPMPRALLVTIRTLPSICAMSVVSALCLK